MHRPYPAVISPLNPTLRGAIASSPDVGPFQSKVQIMKRRSSRGFTLVELMVSIVIVAVLASLAFLMSKRGIEAARAAKCISNMQQINIGLQAAMDQGVRNTHNKPGMYLPYAGQEQAPFNNFIWIDLVASQLGLAEQQGAQWVWNTHPKETIFQNPLSEFSFGANPDNESEWEVLHGNSAVSGGSFTYNYLLDHWVAAHTMNPRKTHRSMVKYPATTMVFGEASDEARKSQQNTIACWGTGNAPQGNYKEKAHLMFADGHVESVPNDHLKNQQWLINYYMAVHVNNIPPNGGPKKTLSPPE